MYNFTDVDLDWFLGFWFFYWNKFLLNAHNFCVVQFFFL